MTLMIHLSADDEERLAARAARTGEDVAGYVRRLIARDLGGADGALAPCRRQVEASGISDDDLESFFEGVRDEVWREKQGQPS
jgi:hypothetical protein